MSKVIFKQGANIIVVRKGTTANAKISDGGKVVQTYTFSEKQWVLATTSQGFSMKEFFKLDHSNCLDCPFSGNSGNGGCYTHKFNQFSGFLKMLRSIQPSDLTPLDGTKRAEIIEMCKDTYVRFGTYGEPSLMPYLLVKEMAEVASSWTGYTHQHSKAWADSYKNFFMASVHSDAERNDRAKEGWLSFIAMQKDEPTIGVHCPASKEMGYKSNCAKCGLCSGLQGKGNVNIKIKQH